MDIKKDGIDPNERVEAVWCQDSETGERVLIDLLTSKIIMRESDVRPS